jgi:hypothetical protein
VQEAQAAAEVFLILDQRKWINGWINGPTFVVS